MAKHNLISIDLAKNVFQLCSTTHQQKIVFNKQLARKDLAEFMVNQPTTEVAMEACYSSHYWARCFQAMGHTVKLLPAQKIIQTPILTGDKIYHLKITKLPNGGGFNMGVLFIVGVLFIG